MTGGYISGGCTLQSMRAQNQAKDAETKRAQDRQRNCLVLISRWLTDQGYLDSAERLQAESAVTLNKFDVADNIDLPTIFQDYEEYYEMKFGKKPKFIRKATTEEKPVNAQGRTRSAELNMKRGGGSLPSIQNGSRSADVTPRDVAPRTDTGRKKIPVPPGSKDAKSTEQKGENTDMDGLITGVAVKDVKKVNDDAGNDYYERRVLKPMPDGFSGELRELAAWITRDILFESPNVHWDDVAELGRAKQLLKEAVVMPVKYPQFFTGLLTPWRGVLLYGPPGTGKTMLAKAVATECQTTFFNISASTIVSKWRGDSEKLIRVLFDLAKYHAPSTIFLDELDAIMSQRDGSEHEGSRRMKTELLIQMDGLSKTSEMVFVLGASNLPWELDTALLRRLEKRIYIPLPCSGGRRIIFNKMLPPAQAKGIDYDAMANATDGYSGSDLVLLCKEAAMKPLRRMMAHIERGEVKETSHLRLDPVSNKDLIEALQYTKPAASQGIERFLQWESEFAST